MGDMTNQLNRIFLFTRIVVVLFLLNSCFPENRSKNLKEDKRIVQVKPETEDLLLYIPPVLALTKNEDSSTTLLVTTADVSRFDNKPVERAFSNSIQMVDADEPWPPRWYAACPFYSDAAFKKITDAQQYRFDFLIDAKVESGFFSFYKILSQQAMGVGQLKAPEFAGYILLNEAFEAVDTVKSKMKGFNMYFHDLRLNAKGERMVDMKENVALDLRKYTGNPKDSAVNCNVDYIQILDHDNNIVFSWDPIKNIDAKLFQFKETLNGKAFASRHADVVEWTRLTSALWDYDGNILYAMKKIGIGKISRNDGHIIWQINYNDMPIIFANDTIEWNDPHDFNLLSQTPKTVIYSLFSNGNESRPARGVIFEMDKKTQKVISAKYITPKTNYMSDGQGNIEYHPNSSYAIGYGFFEKSDTVPGYRSAFEYQQKDGHYGVYQFPQWVYCYKARLLQNWTKPPRPMIVKKGDLLSVDEKAQNVTWYKLSGKDNRKIEKVSNERSIKPNPGVTYCVAQKFGVGFSVSRPYKN